MKLLKHIALGAAFTLSVFCAVFYVSCSKDACKGTTCLNFGTCTGGTCSCKSGTGGTNCQTIFRKLYDGTYYGNAAYSSSDTNFVAHTDPTNSLVFVAGNDTTDFNNMKLTWNRPGRTTVNMSITLSNNNPGGSDFAVTPVTIDDTGSLSGSGTVNTTSASMNLIETFPHSTPIVITLSAFARK